MLLSSFNRGEEEEEKVDGVERKVRLRSTVHASSCLDRDIDADWLQDVHFVLGTGYSNPTMKSK